REASLLVSHHSSLQKFPPPLGQLRTLDFTCDAPLEFVMKRSACSINHDHVFRAFSTNRVRHARWNYDPDVVVATMIIAIDKESHYSPWKPCADIAQNYLNAPLQKKHHVPLLIVITA